MVWYIDRSRYAVVIHLSQRGEWFYLANIYKNYVVLPLEMIYFSPYSKCRYLCTSIQSKIPFLLATRTPYTTQKYSIMSINLPPPARWFVMHRLLNSIIIVDMKYFISQVLPWILVQLLQYEDGLPSATREGCVLKVTFA